MTRPASLLLALFLTYGALILPVKPVVATPAGAASVAADGPSSRPRATIGIVSFNQFRDLNRVQMLRDARRLGARSDVDLIGWQETAQPKSRAVVNALADLGWRTIYWSTAGRENAISFRTSRFVLATANSARMHPPATAAQTKYPFPARWTNTVMLTHRGSGYRLTLLNTHVNQKIELVTARRKYVPGVVRSGLNLRQARTHLAKLRARLARTPGRWLFTTGDFNFDWRGDRTRRPAGMAYRTLSPIAINSFQALGMTGLPATSPDNPVTRRDEPNRYVDYVWARRSDVANGYTRFVSHQVLLGYHSDHRPILARVELH